MIYDLQKASMLKRISAALVDFILLSILVVGFAFLLSVVTKYDQSNAKLEEIYAEYSQQYGVSFDITSKQYDALSQEQKAQLETAYQALNADEEAIFYYNKVINLTLFIISIGVLLGYTVTDFLFPLFFKNGQTLGKKIFGICVVRTDCVRMPVLQLFVRTYIGKYTVESMVPILIVILLYFGFVGIVGTIVLFGLLILQIVLLFTSKTYSLVHDVFAGTAVVDLSTQLVFDSTDDMIEYKKQIAQEKANNSSY